MQKKNNTYTSFKDAFREFEEQPRTEVWENIEASMLKLRKAKMKRNIVVGSSLALAVAALSFFMINNAMETSNDSISNKMSNYNYNDKNIVSNSIVTEKELDGVFDEAINEELGGATSVVKEVPTFVAENKIAKEVGKYTNITLEVLGYHLDNFLYMLYTNTQESIENLLRLEKSRLNSLKKC
jgi:hypothetical protein